MNIFYADNFRGFTNTFIPLKDVNFFVGENSTGKTSIMSLIYLLSNYKFLLSTDFNTEEVKLGFFNDIVNKGKKIFTIGFFSDEIFYKKADHGAMLISFKNREGVPFVTKIRYLYKGYEITIIVTNDQEIKYRFEKFPISLQKVDDFLNYFKSWVAFRSRKKYKKFEEKLANTFELKIFELIAFVGLNISRKLDIEINPFHRLLNTNIKWIAPIRAKPKQTYDNYKIDFSPEGEHIPYLLKNVLQKKSDDERNKFKKLIESFGKESNMFNSISVNNFGNDFVSPFEINIILDSNSFKISNVGYGVSQVLPIVIETILNKDNTWFAIQQPEVHLHPKAQAALGEFFYLTCSKFNQKYIIETHSDYIIDRFRINLRNNLNNNISAQLLFFERSQDGNKIHQIEINDNGEYSEEQPKSFREFFILEEMKILGF